MAQALAGAVDFYYFFAWRVGIDGYRVKLTDHALVSSLLSELTGLVGCETRRWVTDTRLATWRDDFLLTGMVAGGRSVWRLTPSNASKVSITTTSGVTRAGPVTVCLGSVISACVPTACTLEFAEGVALPQGNSTAGTWIVLQGDGRPTLVCGFASHEWPLPRSYKSWLLQADEAPGRLRHVLKTDEALLSSERRVLTPADDWSYVGGNWTKRQDGIVEAPVHSSDTANVAFAPDYYGDFELTFDWQWNPYW